MKRISLIGIDGSGKTSLTHLFMTNKFHTISISSFQTSSFKSIQFLGFLLNVLSLFFEKINFKTLYSFIYLLHLIPYYLEIMCIRNKNLILISDRDPIIDTLCYFKFYFPQLSNTYFFNILKIILIKTFKPAVHYFFLNVYPETALKRKLKNIQLHENKKDLVQIHSIMNHIINELNLIEKTTYIDSNYQDQFHIYNQIVDQLINENIIEYTLNTIKTTDSC